MANGKGSRRRLAQCTDQELSAEWARIFGSRRQPRNRRVTIERLNDRRSPKLTPEEFVAQHRAMMAAHVENNAPPAAVAPIEPPQPVAPHLTPEESLEALRNRRGKR